MTYIYDLWQVHNIIVHSIVALYGSCVIDIGVKKCVRAKVEKSTCTSSLGTK